MPAPASPSLRLGISGVPGVGKSTFIETLGLVLIGAGHRVAVLAVDPSSSLSGGSILGDKTRMEQLSVHERAFVRPSPSGGTLGGVAAATREAIRVVEAAGYDVVIVETVGIGQSEAAVAGMTDCFVLLQLPNAGDDLQAIKKGVLELADLVVVNKADLDPAAAARAVGQLESALRLVGAARCAARRAARAGDERARCRQGGRGLAPGRVVRRGHSAASGGLERRRHAQARAWLWERVDAGLREGFRAHPAVRRLLPDALADVDAGHVPVSVVARRLLSAFAGGAVVTGDRARRHSRRAWRAAGLASASSRRAKARSWSSGSGRHAAPGAPTPLNLLARALGLRLLQAVPAHGGVEGQAIEVERLRGLAAAGRARTGGAARRPRLHRHRPSRRDQPGRADRAGQVRPASRPGRAAWRRWSTCTAAAAA